MSFKLKVYVDPQLAIPVGNTEFGVCVVNVTDDMLRPLKAEVLAELAAAYQADGKDILGPLSVGNWVAALEALEKRAAKKKADDAAAAAVAVAEKKKQAEREASAVKLTLALHKWVTAHGSDSQKARLKEGLLPNDEVLELISDEVFLDYEGMDRYVPIRLADFCECGEGTMSRAFAKALSENRYERLLDIRNDAPKGATITTYHHIGECKMCRSSVERDSVRVSVPWGGVTLHRDFAL